MWHEPTQSVLIDTDIGDDVDDAFGLALALRLHQLLLEIENAPLRIENVDTAASQSTIYNLQSAIDLILACSQASTPLTIIALGPLTNIAAALARDPTLANRARLVAMAGKLGYPYPDWNLRCDPAAARSVLAAGMPITLVGMHVTLRAKMRAEQIRHVFSSLDPLHIIL